MRRAGWIGYQQLLAGELPWLWLTREGLAAYGLRQYKAAKPALNRLHHIHAVNSVRYDLEYDQEKQEPGQWISERAIRAGMYTLPQIEGPPHFPDGIFKTDDGDIAIEVEITQKKPYELYEKIWALVHAWDKSIRHYGYMQVRFYTPDPGIQKALEIARAKIAEDERGRPGERVERVKIEQIEIF